MGPGRGRRVSRGPWRRAAGAGSRGQVSLRYLVGPAIAGDVLAQRLQWVDADARQPRELELDLDRRRILLRGGDEAVRDRTQLPAARIVLDAHEPLEQLAVVDAPVHAGEPGQVAGDRPLARQV